MSDTHPNAMRMEANDLEKQARGLLGRAQELRAQAEALDPQKKPEVKTGK